MFFSKAENIINLNNYLNVISKMNYAITKTDVPYNPKTFPFEYAIGKDLDIYVSSDDFTQICDITNIYFTDYIDFVIKIIKKRNNFRLRIEQNNKLHFQIDITVNNSLIINRIKKSNYYILSLENEKKVRLNEIKKNPNKKYHKEWLIKNKFLFQ